ncbi:MAG TPA: NlpC/P60 family protein [Streptosporangiaceae bacterium]|nr:NlpC/P60 family protein [Streptosporangiaceae bacterium]
MVGVACLALTALLIAPVGPAGAVTSAADAQKKLNALNKLVEKNAESYNLANIQLAAAKKKLAVSSKSAGAEQLTYDTLHKTVALMASSAYKSGNFNDVTSLVSAGDPQSVLDQAAVFTQLSKNRSSELTQFLESAQRLQRAQGQAKDALATVTAQQAKIKADRAGLDKQVLQQKNLIQQAGITTGSSGGSSIGGTYNGPASGNARIVLQYAYAHRGDPYVYGAAGPNSFDCSGLTMMAWQAAGVSLPHNAAAQYSQINHVSAANIRPGDLVFMYGLGHVGIVVNSTTMIHAPSTGDHVRVAPIPSGSAVVGYGRP